MRDRCDGRKGEGVVDDPGAGAGEREEHQDTVRLCLAQPNSQDIREQKAGQCGPDDGNARSLDGEPEQHLDDEENVKGLV